MVKTKENKKCKAAYPFFHQKNIKKKEKKIKKKKKEEEEKKLAGQHSPIRCFPAATRNPI
jgi:hypothetical protein